MLGSTWLQVESSSSPHGRDCEVSRAHVEGALSLPESEVLPPGHSESSPQPVQAFLFRQNIPQQQSSIRAACVAAVDKANKSAKTFILILVTKESAGVFNVPSFPAVFEVNVRLIPRVDSNLATVDTSLVPIGIPDGQDPLPVWALTERKQNTPR